jgi:hypothetical protein
MTATRRWAWAAALAAAAAVAAGCATMRVNSFAQRGQDFSTYHSYAWAPEDQLKTGDPRLDDNSFFLERLQTDVDNNFSWRGLEKTAGSPDLLIHYHVNINQEINSAGLDEPYGYQCDSCEPYVYDKGTLLLDLVDARTNKLVWRGWAEGSMDNAIDNQEFMEQRIDEAVTKILATLPRDL